MNQFSEEPGNDYSSQQNPAGGGQAYAPAAKTNGLAITSMVLGIVGLVGFCFPYLAILLSIGAVIFGHMAKGAIRKSRGAQEGNGMAIAGLATGYIGLLLNAAMLILVIVAIASGEMGNLEGMGR